MYYIRTRPTSFLRPIQSVLVSSSQSIRSWRIVHRSSRFLARDGGARTVARPTLSSLLFHGDTRPRVSSRFAESLHPSRNLKILACPGISPRYYDVKFLGSPWNSKVRARPMALRVGNKKHAAGMCRNKGIACLAPRLPGQINKFARIVAAHPQRFGELSKHARGCRIPSTRGGLRGESAS